MVRSLKGSFDQKKRSLKGSNSEAEKSSTGKHVDLQDDHEVINVHEYIKKQEECVEDVQLDSTENRLMLQGIS